MNTFIAVDNVSYAYPSPGGKPLPALRNLSLSIAAGEYVALVGANGSGKSTLARHLNALLIPQAGSVRVAGLDTRDPATHPELRRLVGMVFQRPEDQIVATTVAEDVAFGPANLGLPTADIQRRVQAALEEVGLWEERQRPPHMLSAGQVQRLALAGVLAMQQRTRPGCLIFDEATAMLDPAGRRTVQALIRRLHRAGSTIVTITHTMEEVLDTERVIVLAAGRVAYDGSPAQLFSDPAALGALGLHPPRSAALIHQLRAAHPALDGTLRDVLTAEELMAALSTTFQTCQSGPSAGLLTVSEVQNRLRHCQEAAFRNVGELPPSHTDRSKVIVARGLGHTYMQGTPLAQRALHDVALTVAEGGAHGILGGTGAGKSTLLQHLNGLLRPQEGQVRTGPYALHNPQTDLRAVRRYAGLAFQQPETQIFEQYVGDEIAFGPRLQGLAGAELRERVRWAMELVGLDFAAFKDRYTFALSGGEQRRVALASVLALRPQVLLLDEPTAGLDPASHQELLARLVELRAAGMTLVLSSHDMEDLARLAERLTVLHAGTTVRHGPTAEVFAQRATLQSWGLDAPLVPALVAELRARGWPLPPTLLHDEAFIAHIVALLQRRQEMEASPGRPEDGA